jgi:hypothetical protein
LRPNKGNKVIEREVLASYQIAQSLGFHGDFRAWEHLLRIHKRRLSVLEKRKGLFTKRASISVKLAFLKR